MTEDQDNEDNPVRLSDQQARDDIAKRLRRVEGQLRGVIRMVEEGANCRDVAQQMSAARKALDSVYSRMTVCYLEQELASAAQQDPRVGRAIGEVAILLSRF